MMETLLFSTALLAAGGLASAVVRKAPETACRIGSWTTIAALLIMVCQLIFFFPVENCTEESLIHSAKIYQLPILVLGICASLYAPTYLKAHAKEQCGRFFLFYNLTVGAMLWVTMLHTMIPFLIAWELMGLFSFFLVISDKGSEKSRQAGWIYLLGCEAGGLLLMLACVLQYKGLIQAHPLLYFILLVLGFGLKAGFVLLHVWLPQAHPAAPAPVSALMSGAMIVLGFCGLFRFLPQETYFQMLCGWFLLIAGMIGAFGGILCAMVQKDLKSLLAYSSVENVGIIAMGFGLGCLGNVYNGFSISICGFAGAILHILNHALLKGTLFLGAGTVLATTHTLNMDQLGGLMKTLPRTGTLFTLASVGICGLPPFCAFTGELLIYLTAFRAVIDCTGIFRTGAAACAIVLALTGATACAVFAKAVSGVFLGEGRSTQTRECAPEQKGFYLPLYILTILSLLMPFWADKLLSWILNEMNSNFACSILENNRRFIFCLLIPGILIWFLRNRKKNSERKVGTWDCGYAKPDARMEYTPTAFVQPLADLFNGFLHQKKTVKKPQGLFMKEGFMDTETPDPGERFFWEKIFCKIIAVTGKIHLFQSGYLHLYILVMVLAVLLMLCAGFFGINLFTGGK